MTTFSYTQNSFSNGCMSEGYIARNDLNSKAGGVAILSNAHTTYNGSIKRRSGLKYVAKLSEEGKLFSFNYKSKNIFLLILSEYKMHIYQDDKLIITLSTPYKKEELSSVQTSQNISEMVFTHQNHTPLILTFKENYGFTFNPISWNIGEFGEVFCPYYKFTDTSSVSLTPSSTTGEIKLTSNKDFFTSNHVNMNFKINGACVKILNILSATQATAFVYGTLSSTSPCLSFLEQSFSIIRGYPKTSAFHQGRLVFASTKSQPNKIWFSKTHNYYNFDFKEGLDDEAIEFELLSSGTEEIQTLFSSHHLQILTYSGEWVVVSDHITPSTVSITKQTTIGSPTDISLPVMQVESTTIFISKDKKEVREFVYGEALGNYTSNNVSILAPHLIKDPIDISYNKTMNQLFIVLSNGEMAVLTIIPQNQIVSWSNYTTCGKFLSIKSYDDKMYVIVKRNNGIFLEKFDENLNMDCSMENEFDFDIYKNDEIYIKSENYVYAKIKAQNQNINFPKNYSVGLPYSHTIIPFPLTKLQGSSYKKYRLIELGIKMLKSYVLELDTGFGLNKHYLTHKNFDEGLKEFSGDFFINTLGYKSCLNEPLWKIQSDMPFNFETQSISLKIKAI